ncbi:hypothetical protein [Mycobacterium asiaticum]|uniref:CDGP domain-containing protein n=1 Tax=Mycobacterium asiaticum TaxID=1790 RepID=A0A1A3UTY9_MYCAS|nr:hypothetical protein [Mycobacterium asiaticum]OBK17786.1 hypothetical protein A5635_04000 [Mycobacterium asiaticum]OBK98314.1 hypothetical protein A5645_03710 [Mycobacterium asiaticum]
MKRCISGGLVAMLTTTGLIAAAPPAGAGCIYGGLATISRCDGPVEPDGTWQRCVVFDTPSTGPTYRAPDRRCDTMGPDLHPWGFAFNDPPTHIDD